MIIDNDLVEGQAHDAWNKGELNNAYKLFGRCALAGSVSCMLNVGFFYDEGLGVSQDKAKAMLWYKRVYRKGDPSAASNIAILYREQGRNRLMFQWFRRAADLGDGDAELELARLYMQGIGVRRSLSKAEQLLRSALTSTRITEAGREEVVGMLDSMEREGENS